MKRILVLIFSLAVLVGAVFLLDAFPASVVLLEDTPETISEEAAESFYVYFSETEHFFAGGVSVEIFSSREGAEIYYTLDGAKPTRYSALFSAPIEFSAERDVELAVLRAIAVYGDEISEPVTHTFFFGRGVNGRFDTLIFSLSTDRDHLYCFYTGILVEGITRRQYRQANPGVNIDPTAPANFNWRGREGERPMHVEVFHADGTRVLNQAAGARVFGSWSRAERVKSIRLIARREYSPHAGRFHYEFFPGDVVICGDGFRAPITAYNTLILRNGGNDRNHGIFSNELGSRLARRGGFMDVTPTRAAVMFINGNYYGYMWLQTRFDEHYLQELYNTPTRDFDVVSRGEWWFRYATEEQEDALTYKNEFAWRDLTNDAEFARLNEIVCVDNLLWYYAFQIWLANADWPHNNLRRWRFTGEPFPGMADELDGRWRYAIFDLDQVFGLFGQNYRRPTFQIVLENDNDHGQLIRNILTRQDMAERFTMMFNDLASNVLSMRIFEEEFLALYNEIMREVDFTIAAGNLLDHWVSRYSIGGNHFRMVDFAEFRHRYIFNSLANFFDFEQEFFDVVVTGGEAIIGTVRANSARYFAHLTVPITPVLPENTAFSHWIVNNATIENYEIFVNANPGEIIEIELVTRPYFPPLAITDMFVTAEGSGLALVNNSDAAIRTEGLFLSNRRHELDRFPLPAATLEPGDILEFAGREGRCPNVLFRVRMNFNLREGRRVFLSDENGEIIYSVIP